MPKRNFDNSKVSDRYAIIPTGKIPPGGLSSDAAKLYDLIARQFLLHSIQKQFGK